MKKFEQLILRWVCLFDEFEHIECTNIKHLTSSKSFKEFVGNVFFLKSCAPSISDGEELYNTLKVNYSEFEVEKYEDIFDEQNNIYTCIVVLLHALLKCANDTYRNQLSEKMNNEEQIILAKFLKATQSLTFTQKNISEALLLLSDINLCSSNISSEMCSTPIKSKSTRRSYLQEFCESPKSQSLIYQEKEKIISKLTDDYKNECEENYKLAENNKILQDLNKNLSSKLEDKDKVIKCLKDEIEELLKPKKSPDKMKADDSLKMKKLNQDNFDLEMNINELRQQILDLENQSKDLKGKFENKQLDCDKLLLTMENLEIENISLKESINLLNEELHKKQTEIMSLKDELCNRSISINPTELNSHESNFPSNTLFDELNCIKLEEITHNKEKYRHKYKTVKKDLLKAENEVKDLKNQISIFKQQLDDYEVKEELLQKCSTNLQDSQKQNKHLESKIKYLKDVISDKEYCIESTFSKLNLREDKIKELSLEIDTVKKAKSMIELILKKTNAEIETLHEENNKKNSNLLATIDNYKKSEELLNKHISELEDNIKQIQDDIEKKEGIIFFYEEKMADNFQAINEQEEQLKAIYLEKLSLESHLKSRVTEVETQQKMFNDKNREMENCLEYYLDELKDVKSTKAKVEEILHCKQNEIDRQIELINYQKNIIETLQSEKCSQEVTINNLNGVLQKMYTEDTDLKEKVLESTLNLNKLKEQLNVALNEKVVSENNLKINEVQMKKSNEEFQRQIYDMKNVLKTHSDEINQYKIDIKELKDAFEKKQNEFNEQLIISNKQIETTSHLRLEKYELEEKLKSSSQVLLVKENEIKSLEEKHIQSELKIKNLTEKVSFKISENHCLTKNLELITLTLKNMDNDFVKHLQVKTNLQSCDSKLDSLTESIFKLKNYLHDKESELVTQIDLSFKQKENILNLESENLNLSNKLKVLEQSFMDKDTEIINLKNNLQDYSSIIKDLEEQLGVMNIEKIMIETNLNETIEQFKNAKEQSTGHTNSILIKLNDCEDEIVRVKNQYLAIEKTLEKKHEELNKLQKLTLEQNEVIKNIKLEREILEKQVLDANEHCKTTQAETKSLLENLNEQKLLIVNLEKELSSTKLAKTTVEAQLKDAVCEKEVITEKLGEQINEVKSYLKDSSNENNDLKICLTKLNKDFDEKLKHIEHTTEENNKFKESIVSIEKQYKSNLEDELQKLSDCIKDKDEIIKLLEFKNSECLITNGKLEKQGIELKEALNDNLIQLVNQNQLCDEQSRTIVKIIDEKESLSNNIKSLEDTLSHKEYEFNLCEGKLYDCCNTINDLEKKIEDKSNQNSSLKLLHDETISQMTKENEDLTLQLDIKEKQLSEIQEKLNHGQKELEKQVQIITTLTHEINKLKEYQTQNENVLASNEDKLLDYDKQNKEIKSQNASLLLELKELKCKLNDLRQESSEQINKMGEKIHETHQQLSLKQSEIGKQIELKNDSLADIYQKINDLKKKKNELELVLKKERADFETCLETCSNCIYSRSIKDNHQDSLMEVITSADTFIEQNGIQIIQVENCDEYSIIERLKKLFEALKMFIININTLGNEQSIKHTDNEYVSNEIYADLLAKSNTQFETIKYLENEMSKLKSECNYKMTKVQQKTQEYVTSEYEKKFERKREQMKQFCKDLETKIHQDYEAKLMKYKEKIHKDEIHIKELGQQLWELSDKYLRLQQKERRESTMSLPFETLVTSQNTITSQMFTSFTLPKSSSAGQIRSLIEETTRPRQDYLKRNVPVGIGKKFSLSSGKIFPKEEDEEGEMFNHSCLSDLKQGKVNLSDNNDKIFNERLSELQARNSLCPPHLRSSYAVETNYLPNTSLITEEDIKTSVDFSDCESENLIPNDRNKKKDRNQTSYKKPGPPTPSKNGGRNSLSGNTKITLKETKESNATNKKRLSSTPNKLFSLFMSKKN